MNQSTSSAQVATNLLNVLQGYTKGIRFVAVLTMLLTIGIGQAWGAEGDTHNFSQSLSQLLNYSASIASIEIAEQSYAIKTVKITSDYNKTAGGVTMEVFVGGISWGTATHNSDEPKTFTFNGTSTKGNVTIKFTNNCGSGTGKGTFKVTNVQLIEGASASANPCTVTLNAGSGTCEASVTETSAGAGVTLPTPTLDGCDEWSFAGWKTTSAVTTETTTEPTLIPAGAYSPTSDITLYAVYQRTETTEGTPTTTNDTYTHTIEAKTWSENGAQTLNSISWTLDNNGSYYGYESTKGQQVGSSGSPAKSMTLTTSGFASATKITAVRISTSGANSISGNVSVKVGSTAYTSGGNTTKSLTSTNTEYEFTGSSTENITISWSQTSSKAIYFKTIEVDYQTTTAGGGSTTTLILLIVFSMR